MGIVSDQFPRGEAPWPIGTMVGDILEKKGLPAHLWVEPEGEHGDDQQWRLTWIERSDPFDISEVYYGAGDTLEEIHFWFEHTDDAINAALFDEAHAHFNALFKDEPSSPDDVWFDHFRIRIARSVSGEGGVIDFDRSHNGTRSTDPALMRYQHDLAGRLIVQFKGGSGS